jgi:flavin-dependent dehydrogenase
MTVALDSNQASALAGRERTAYVLQEAREIPELFDRLMEAEIEGEVLACGPFDRPVLPHFIEGMVLLGDAAGYYDPLTGQGIYRALRSSELAAPALLQSLLSGRSEPIRQFVVDRNQEFAFGTKLQHFIERLNRQPLLWRSALRLVGAVPLLRNKLAEVIGDCPKEAQPCIPVMKSP